MNSKRNGDVFSENEWATLIAELALSSRQSEIIRWLFKGLTDREIAGHMGIQTTTVRMHMSRLFLRMNVHDRNQLILRVFHQFRSGCPLTQCPWRKPGKHLPAPES